jgi:peptide/nickel transport system permease protein
VLNYVLRRFLHLVPVLFVVSLALFVLLRLLPGDPSTAILGQEATEEQRAALRTDLGLDEPLWRQYVDWIAGIFRGDLGQSWLTREPVGAAIADRLPVTVELGITSLVLATLIGIPLGILAAVRARRATDSVVTGAAMLLLSIPHFYLATLLVLLFAVTLRWLPASGFVPFTENPAENIKYLILPAVTIGSTIVAVAMRQTRGSLLATLGEDYVRTAEATGLGPRRIVLVHAMRNALAPVTTVIALQVGALMSATVITETIFTLPGMGTLIVNAIFSRDMPIVQGAVLVVVAFVLAVNLLTDLIYAWLDPRIAY